MLIALPTKAKLAINRACVFMEQEACEKLLEEYQALRRRIEEVDFTQADVDELPEEQVSEEDLDRLEALRDRLESECDIELPDDMDTDIDLPEYAVGSPSEPRDFSSK